MFKLNKDNGVTIIALGITIVVLIILAGITISAGSNIVKTINTEEIQTNLISIRSKAKVIAEEVNAKIWTEEAEEKEKKREETYKEKYGMVKQEGMPIGTSQSPVSESEYECYEITEKTLKEMGLPDIFDQNKYYEGVRYYVLYDSNDYTKLDIIYDPGIVYGNTTYNSLAKLQEAAGTDVKE